MYNGLIIISSQLAAWEVGMQPKQRTFFFWKLVQRENATRYMLISLLSSVATVITVRSFLALTGYPQIGSGTLHIAHVLWGGLILYIAAILPLIYLNPRLHIIGAVLSGVGVGLFIDEVGKFITRQYDYFFPAAAPIMYVFFLFVIILVIMIRRPPVVDGRAELVQTLEIVREQLYRPLDQLERAHVERDMNRVMETDPNILHKDLARHLLELVRADTRRMPEKSLSWWLRIADRFVKWLTERRLSWLLGVGMALLGLFTLKNPLQIWLELSMPGSALVAFLHAHSGRQIPAIEAQGLFSLRLGLEVVVGLMLLVSAILLLVGKKRLAISLGYLSLLLSIAVLDMLLFYFEQFSTILVVVFQFMVLIGMMYYRQKYQKPDNRL
jgi:hypothetical protein